MHQATFANLVEPVNPILTYLKTKALLMFTINRNAIFCSPIITHISLYVFFLQDVCEPGRHYNEN